MPLSSSVHACGCVLYICVCMHVYMYLYNLLPPLSGVELYGSDYDESGRRKHFTTVNDLYKRTWTPTSTSRLGLSQLALQLLRLLMKMFSDQCGLAPPTSSYTSLQQYCQERFAAGGEEEGEGEGEGGGDSVNYLNLAHPQVQTLSLVYPDSQLLCKFLQILNLLTVVRLSNSWAAEMQLYEEFVLFLYNNCQDHSCFFEPIRRVLGDSPGDSHLSRLFISLVTYPPSRAFKGRCKPHKAEEFIRCGGGTMVLRNLVTWSRRPCCTSGGGSSGFSTHSINKLGQKDSPYKSLSDSTELVDFFPLCSAHLSSSKGIGKVSQSSKATSLFEHAFTLNEKWIQLHLVFPHPVLLHNFMACVTPAENSTVVHSGPSQLLIESSAHGGLDSSMPVTPVFSTNGLKIVNVAFFEPVLTQHLTVHLHRPLLSGNIMLSRVEVLGSEFGRNAQSITPKPRAASLLTQQDQEENLG